jgi:hypothetical protein
MLDFLCDMLADTFERSAAPDIRTLPPSDVDLEEPEKWWL